jgi:hypothetical protein
MTEPTTNATPTDGSTDDVIRDLAEVRNRLPETSIRWALDNWDTAAPRFIELLTSYAEGTDRSPETTGALFFVVHLLGERRETRAFPALCRLVYDTDAMEEALGDAATETLTGILISTFDGDLGRLKALIEANEVDEYTRSSALDALAYLTWTGAQPDAEMRDFLQHLLTVTSPDDGFLWSSWALCAANLGYADFSEKVKELTRSGMIPPGYMHFKHFKEQLARTLADPERKAGFDYDRIGPFTDTIATLSTWHGFSEKYRKEKERLAAAPPERPLWSGDEPYTNPFRHVGRNDPCPCGSGQKFKKCCGA